MAIVAGKKWDVFVSYAGLGDAPKSSGQSWVAIFVDHLRAEIAKYLGVSPEIFFDQETMRVGDHLEIYERSAAQAAVMLILVSPAYFRSPWATQELRSFRKANPEPGRLFVAEVFPSLGSEPYPAEIEGIFRLELWERGATEAPVLLSPRSRRFREQIARLGSDIAERLHAMNRPPAPATSTRKAPAARKRTAKRTPAPGKKPAVAAIDRYRTQTDDPTRVDALERKPFAAVLARRIIEVRLAQEERQQSDDRAFMVHLHGPWGSGKSSMLILLEEKLQDPKLGAPPSLIVWFNAWKHQRMRPPWWALLTAIYNAATRGSGDEGAAVQRKRERRRLRWLWWKWRLRADLLPGVLVALLLGGVAFSLLWGRDSSTAETVVKIIVSIIAAGATLTAYAKLIAFGSDRAAKTYADLTSDPFSPVIRLFDNLVKAIPRPLVVFIEDLDRCDSEYVVELLEGIQTLFREAAVTYVVAAERRWICTSFDKKYGDFSGSIGEPCRPLGYLFVDKIFQISAGMPRLTPDLQAQYLAALLAEGEPEKSDPATDVVAAATARVNGLTDEAALQDAIAEQSKGTIAEQRAIRAAAALQITSAEAMGDTEHRLQKFAHLLEPNPRSMKRLVNEVGMAQALGLLEGRGASPETRARWTILTLRWPVFADFIAENPEAIRHWAKPGQSARSRRAKPAPDARWPKEVQDLIGNKALIEVVGGTGDEGALTPDSLAPLLS